MNSTCWAAALPTLYWKRWKNRRRTLFLYWQLPKSTKSCRPSCRAVSVLIFIASLRLRSWSGWPVFVRRKISRLRRSRYVLSHAAPPAVCVMPGMSWSSCQFITAPMSVFSRFRIYWGLPVMPVSGSSSNILLRMMSPKRLRRSIVSTMTVWIYGISSANWLNI